MTLQEILNSKGGTVFTIGPEATLADVAQKLVQHNIGSLLVRRPVASGDEELLGIVTERDLLHACAGGKCDLATVSVTDAMTARLITAAPDDRVEEIMGLMTAKRIRHLPVLSEGKLVGLISIGDVVKTQHDHLAMENRFMKDYIGRSR